MMGSWPQSHGCQWIHVAKYILKHPEMPIAYKNITLYLNLQVLVNLPYYKEGQLRCE